MIVPNATITSFRAATATQGDGAVVYGINAVVVPIPVELIDPSAHRIETDRQRGIRNDAMVRVGRAAIDGQDIEPKAGDRIEYLKPRLGVAATAMDITDTRDVSAGMAVELTLAVRDDDAVETQEGGA